ncbi:MAG: S8 family serine peptidase, partial [Candidatus Zixiibacteriota bacterium]
HELPGRGQLEAHLVAGHGGCRVDAFYASSILGGDGSGIKVIDVEGGWRVTHEDLIANPPFVQIGGQIGSLEWRNHGTAVMGEIMGLDNGAGVRGISPGVQWGYSSIASQTTSGALMNAGSALDPGDVVLIELHAPGPQFNFESREDQRGYVCMEFWQDNFDAILQLFADGIVVCEAAGNGAENFDDPLYGTIFDTTFRNSHAIICGAGAPPSGAFGADRSRLGFSNWGERVNLQGYGAGVVTLGYGDLFNGGSEDTWYTAGFSGTSSASPIVTGSVAALQGAHKANFGFPLDADEIRTLLNNTGSPQVGSEHIGPRPNLQAAFDEALGVT